jgi:preprotein translocase subunit YajC
MFINIAFAEEVAQEAPSFSSTIGSIVPLIIFVGVFYFLLIRPQQQREKQHQEEVKGLKPNDKIITSGGVFGVIRQVKEKVLIVEVSKDVNIEVMPDSVNLIKDEVLEGKVEKDKQKKK